MSLPILHRLVPVMVVVAFLDGLPSVCAETTPESDPWAVRFAAEIEPILKEHCFECHSHAAKKVKGGLVLDSRSGWATGGASGPAIVPGQPDQSLLLQAVQYEDLEMPPSGRLSAADIAALTEWIAAGAYDPRQGGEAVKEQAWDPEEGRRHWAFQPLASASVPSVADQNWPQRNIDRYVLAALEERSIQVAEDADPYVWLRRVSFDLTGLPPSLELIESFVSDPSPLARERVVERLLASRSFGERWARHWLDLVGYADQVGTSNNVFAEHAWRYRDYVIAAFNEDKPFDQFIREQIAGDLLEWEQPDERRQNLTATGFLVLGDIEIVEADKKKLLVDIVDQQLNKVGKAFLGMTFGCARCHDHKFDPVSQRDYYAMAGFFHGTSSIYKTDRGVWSDINVRELPENDRQEAERVAAKEKHFARLDQWREERDAAQNTRASLEAQLKEADLTDENKSQVTKQRDALSQRLGTLNRNILHGEYFYPKVPMAHGVKEAEAPGDMRITVRGNPRALGDLVPRGVMAVMDDALVEIPEGESGRRQFADWIARQPLAARVVVNRVWQKLFGEGLVRTVDYFGLPGDPPSHPELLDYLATQLVRNGWSQKQLIRELVLSRTYGLSSTHNEMAAAKDPENRYLWRMRPFRLDAEALRDTMILVSGQLVRSSGGPAMPLEFPENVGGLDPKDVNPRSFRFSKWRPRQSAERTVYLPVIRHAAQPGPAALRNVFDFAQPSEFTGKRAVTAVPTQALFLMNGSEVKEYAGALAKRLISEVPDTEQRLATLWLRVFSRPVTAEELTDARGFLSAEGDGGWQALCHALLASNEFLMRI